MDSLLHQIALLFIPYIGPVNTRNLISYCGSAEKVFSSSKQKLLKVPGIGEMGATAIIEFNDFKRAENEIKFIEKHKIKALFFTDKEYPARLKNYNDSPVFLFYRGSCDLNFSRGVAIVGTRKATDYGKNFTEKLVAELAPFKPVIISGLAYGIDVCSHRAALQNEMDTIGVLAHGLQTIYPGVHRSIATKMIEQGGLLTEYTSTDDFNRENFPSRNRIVAALCDCLVVVESAVTGGALITAYIANEYNKDVFAVPGRAGDEMSEGCNAFIKLNKAALIESAEDLVNAMGWKETGRKPIVQKELLLELSEEERPVIDILKNEAPLHVDALSVKISVSQGKLASVLLGLELKGAVTALPGKMYKLS